MTAQPDNIIRIENLSFRYPGAAQDTLRNVNLTVARGDFVAIIGGNGSAKTTLCKTLNGLVPHYWSGEFAGTVEVDGIDTWTSSVAELSHRVGYVYQDFSNQLVRPTVADEVRFGPVNFGRADLAERADDTLARLGIVELSQKFVWQLSGGQAHLTALASVLSLEPTILVVDEPVAELDPQRAEILYERLTELNQQHGITIITIEHHAEFIARYARSVVLMAEGTPVWHLPIDDALGRLAELEKHGIPAPQTFVAARALGVEAIPRTVTEAVSAIAGAGLHPSPQWPSDADALDAARCGQVRGDVVARAVDVSHGYRSVHGHVEEVLSHVDLDLHDGDRIALVGGNGAGKSTLMRLLAGITVPRSGNLFHGGTNTRSEPAPRLAEYAAYLHQHPELMFLKGTVRDDVALFPRERRHPDADTLVDRILSRVRLAEFADRDARGLSGGQQRRATLAIGLAMRPTVLLLDEPTSSLDVSSRDDVTHMLEALADSIRCTVVATHDMHLVAEWANRVIVLDRGRIVCDTSPRELFSNPAVLMASRLVAPEVTRIGHGLGLSPVPLTVAELRTAFGREGTLSAPGPEPEPATAVATRVRSVTASVVSSGGVLHDESLSRRQA